MTAVEKTCESNSQKIFDLQNRTLKKKLSYHLSDVKNKQKKRKGKDNSKLSLMPDTACFCNISLNQNMLKLGLLKLIHCLSKRSRKNLAIFYDTHCEKILKNSAISTVKNKIWNLKPINTIIEKELYKDFDGLRRFWICRNRFQVHTLAKVKILSQDCFEHTKMHIGKRLK